MLEELLIRDVGVIPEVAIQPAPGLNVFSGETGAGKTMVVAALGLLLGERADPDQVRAGADVATVEARLRPPPHSVRELITEGDDELVVAREVAGGETSSRSRARVGGRLAPVSALAEGLGGAVELHGQAESTRLADPALQRQLLDRFGGSELAEVANGYAEAYRRLRDGEARLAQLHEQQAARSEEHQRLTAELTEIDAVNPQPGEEEALAAELTKLEHAETLVEAASAAAAAVTDDGGARDALGSAVAALRSGEDADESLAALRHRLEGASAEAQDVALELSGYADGLEADPERVEELRRRRAALAGLTRSYGPDLEAVIARAEHARARLTELGEGEQEAATIQAEVEAARTEVQEAGDALSAARREAGDRLVSEVADHLADLAMPQARMEVRVEPGEPGPNGLDRVAFDLAANAGEPAVALGKAASGGERSRVALAIRLALADADETPILVFDEVDAGIGGATAVAVGEKLARLARGRQVLCVTHLAQLAAYADAHFVVSKSTDNGRTAADVAALKTEDDRVSELARMLSGAPDSEAALANAAELRQRAFAATPRSATR
jgi:DNA repair protein RecN (Recombination protein N)